MASSQKKQNADGTDRGVTCIELWRRVLLEAR
jgi:hypothetical protein